MTSSRNIAEERRQRAEQEYIRKQDSIEARILEDIAQEERTAEIQVQSPSSSREVARSRADTRALFPGSSPTEVRDEAEAKPTGQTIVHTQFANRSPKHLPAPRYEGNGTGRIVVRVTVDAAGNVTNATYLPQQSTTNSSALINAALGAAKQSRFNAATVESEHGTITYDYTSTAIGQSVHARNIQLTAFNSSDREVTRAARASRLRVDFELTANQSVQSGDRKIYARITGPTGVLTNNPDTFATIDGENLTYTTSREIDYANELLPISLYYNGSEIAGGAYNIEIYMDGYLCGSAETILR